MQFDFVNVVAFGVLAFVAFLLYRRNRATAADEEEDNLAVDQQRDVLRAIKSMKKDRES